jgi:YD repeat-containing protein
MGRLGAVRQPQPKASNSPADCQSSHAAPLTVWKYDADGALRVASEPSSRSPDGWRTTGYRYDAKGRLWEVQHPDPVTGALAATETLYAYYANDLVQTVTDPLGRVSESVYDGLNRLIEQRLPAVTVPNTSPPVTEIPTLYYYYDAAGNLLYRRDTSGLVTWSTYDEFRRLASESVPRDPLQPNLDWSQVPTTTYGYTLTGQLNLLTNTDGNVVDTAFDRHDRVAKQHQPRPATATPGSAPYTALAEKGTHLFVP